MTQKQPRKNKSKEELLAIQRQQAKVEHEKSLMKLLFPFIEGQDSIYDAQTVLNAAAGYIEFNLNAKVQDIKVQDLGVSLKDEPESKLKGALELVLGQVGPESAKDTINLLRRAGNAFAQFGASEFLKKPMSNVKITDLIKE